MTALICGSVAFDTIKRFPERFRDHILADRMDVISVCFTAPEMRREFGGCAGNIAYTLKLLGGDPLPMAAVGHDFAPYALWMDRNGIERRLVTEVEAYTAQAFITTDADGNQITTFHPGAMDHAHLNSVGEAGGGVRIGIVAPDGRRAMVRHAAEFAERGIPFIFDPGQQLHLFGPEEIARFLDDAAWVAVNTYEWSLLQERSGLDADEIVGRVEAAIVTRGAEGSSVLRRGGEIIDVPAVAASQEVDPTGCGDAYRAGLLFGLEAGFDWETTGRIASLAGALKVAHPGCQNHRFDPEGFAARFREAFGYSFLPPARRGRLRSPQPNSTKNARR